jgi:RNA polymerase sigma-70 factor (ECF subfamily)
VAEVAVMLDCAEGTVKSRCSRGRERLAGLLRDQLGGDRPGDGMDLRERGHPEPQDGPPRPIPASPSTTTPSTTTPAREGGAP